MLLQATRRCLIIVSQAAEKDSYASLCSIASLQRTSSQSARGKEQRVESKGERFAPCP